MDSTLPQRLNTSTGSKWLHHTHETNHIVSEFTLEKEKHDKLLLQQVYLMREKHALKRKHESLKTIYDNMVHCTSCLDQTFDSLLHTFSPSFALSATMRSFAEPIQGARANTMRARTESVCCSSLSPDSHLVVCRASPRMSTSVICSNCLHDQDNTALPNSSGDLCKMRPIHNYGSFSKHPFRIGSEPAPFLYCQGNSNSRLLHNQHGDILSTRQNISFNETTRRVWSKQNEIINSDIKSDSRIRYNDLITNKSRETGIMYVDIPKNVFNACSVIQDKEMMNSERAWLKSDDNIKNEVDAGSVFGDNNIIIDNSQIDTQLSTITQQNAQRDSSITWTLLHEDVKNLYSSFSMSQQGWDVNDVYPEAFLPELHLPGHDVVPNEAEPTHQPSLEYYNPNPRLEYSNPNPSLEYSNPNNEALFHLFEGQQARDNGYNKDESNGFLISPEDKPPTDHQVQRQSIGTLKKRDLAVQRSPDTQTMSSVPKRRIIIRQSCFVPHSQSSQSSMTADSREPTCLTVTVDIAEKMQELTLDCSSGRSRDNEEVEPVQYGIEQDTNGLIINCFR